MMHFLDKDLQMSKERKPMKFDDVLFFVKKAGCEELIEILETLWVTLRLENYDRDIIYKNIKGSYYEVQIINPINGAKHFVVVDIRFYYGFSKERRDYISKIEAHGKEVRFPKTINIFRLESTEREKFKEFLDEVVVEVAKM